MRQFRLAAKGLGPGSRGSCGKFGRRMGGDVIVRLDGERSHLQSPSAVDYRDHDIHHSDRGGMQANSARVMRWEGDGLPPRFGTFWHLMARFAAKFGRKHEEAIAALMT